MHTTTATTSMPKRTPPVRLHGIDDMDKRTRPHKRAASRKSALLADIGNDPSTAQEVIATHAALTDCIVEDLELKWLQGEQIDFAAYASLTNTLRRLLSTLGIRRMPRDVLPTLDAYAEQVREHEREGATP